jgi:serine phosphatase RsbU (regulator of sigma subunit)
MVIKNFNSYLPVLVFVIVSLILSITVILLPTYSIPIFLAYAILSISFAIYITLSNKPAENTYSSFIEYLFSSIYNVSQKKDIYYIVKNSFLSNGINVGDVFVFLEDETGNLRLRSEHLKGEHLRAEHLKGEHIKGEKVSISSIIKSELEFIRFVKSSKYRIPFVNKRNTTLLPYSVFNEILNYFESLNTNIMIPIYTPTNDVVGLVFANIERVGIKNLIYLSKLLNIVLLSFREIELSEKRRILEEDLKIAVDLQRKLIPSNFVNTEFFDSYGFYKPAYQIGGDYIDIIESSENFIFAVGDVAGKGVSAALVTMIVKSVLNSTDIKVKNFQSSIERLNNFIYNWFYDQESTMTFITLLTTIFIPKKKLLYYINAGHVPGIIVSSDGNVRELKSTSTPVGLFEKLKPKIGTISIKKGDIMVLYTDGLIEQIDKRGREFGIKRLTSVITSHLNESPEEIIRHITEEFEKFSDSEANDDIAILVAKFK